MASSGERDLIIAISPFERPDLDLVEAFCESGALGVLDLGRSPASARNALAQVNERARAALGIRLIGHPTVAPEELPELVEAVVLAEPPSSRAELARWAADRRRVFVEVRSLEEAEAALAAGASRLIARGSESGGRVGDETSFVLLTRLVGSLDVPVWVAGGVGVHTAAAAIAAGAAGVVLDSQLALLRDSTVPDAIGDVIRKMDGSETTVLGGYRVYLRPGLLSASFAPDTDPEVVESHLGHEDVQRQLLPAGQDAAFAATFARRWPTAGSLVQGLRRQIALHLDSARSGHSLRPGSPFAEAHRLQFPIVQGPMTRVSDRAAFADAVASQGALPFLALALATGEETRRLLEETSARLGDRSWGVGILGFVPPELRQAQLGVIHDLKPPFALIAGGRPSQAKPLEEVGIGTYLHVPSPGLLTRFLKEGARRFVFEGRECGGHVGPRSSFTLWESQIETLLASGVSGCSVLFAGGIHDGRSAAAVSAMAAPLAERGTKVGVLMGTAYLFTDEAVEHGAILKGYQLQALNCDKTVLLETSPGHATRCADSEYVRFFRSERARLEQAGTTHEEMWAILEGLNLGRLRIASKGLVHGADGLEEAPQDLQERDGMFMLGQVASLHSSTTTISALHEEVSVGSAEILEGTALRSSEIGGSLRPATPPPAEVAIVGMACAFPGAVDGHEYWSNLVTGVDSITEVPQERWDVARYYDADAMGKEAGRKTPSKWGGFLPDIAFDALSYGIPPRSLASIEPVQLLALQSATEALRDAGYGPETQRDFNRDRVSVVFGAESGNDLASAYGFRGLAEQYLGGLPDALDRSLPELTEDSFPGILTNVIAGRIANRLDLGGVNFTVDAACASSLAAVDVAIKELIVGTSDMVLCGGADVHNGINDYLLFSAVHALSSKGRCASFDASADGIALGEGVACIVLKRLADARRDGDRVYAVIEAVAGSSDGRSLGLTAPRPEGQHRALERAYDQARIEPGEVGLIEAHGTGTVVGDRTELAVLTEVFADAGATPASCALGSVKSQIGHTKCAAGLASLIKAARAVYHGVLPPTINLAEPNPGYDRAHSPFFFNSDARPWIAEHRVAGVSAFGFGGTNFHAVLRSPDLDRQPAPRFGVDRWPAELFLIRGEDQEAALELGRRLERAAVNAARYRGGDSPTLRDLAASTWRAGTGAVRLAIVAPDLGQLAQRVGTALTTLHTDPEDISRPSIRIDGVFVAEPSGPSPGALALLFPGQGSQRPGMLSDLFVTFPGLRKHLRGDERLLDAMFPSAAFGPEDRKTQSAAITDTTVAQPTMGMADLAVADLLATLGVIPALAGGHSYGELVALTVAGALDEEDLVALSSDRAQSIVEAAGANPGAMAAVAADAAAVGALLGDDSAVLANDNSPSQVVISGSTKAVDAASSRLEEAGMRFKRLPVACAFHSPVVAAAAHTFAGRLAGRTVSAPRFPVWSNSTAQPYPSDPAAIRALLAEQIARPVRFREQIESMYEAGARTFVEAGPGRVLTGLVKAILSDRPHRAIAVGSEKGDLVGLLSALAELAVAGIPVQADVLFDGRTRNVDLDATASVPGWTVNGHLVRVADGSVVPGGLLPATEQPVVERLEAATRGSAMPGSVPSDGSPGMVPPSSREAVVAEYLRGMREVVASGREVMLRYLGAPESTPIQLDNMIEVTQPTALTAEAELGLLEPTGPSHGLENGHSSLPSSLEKAPLRRSRAALTDVVLATVSDRTGYPVDMLEPGLDLEADLSIDSIKRLEIAGELAERIGFGGETQGDIDESVIEELVAVKTLDGIVTWLETTLSAVSETDGAPGAPEGIDDGEPTTGARSTNGGRGREIKAPADDARSTDVPTSGQRFVPRLVRAEVTESESLDSLRGKEIVITDDTNGVGAALYELLSREDAVVRLIGNEDPVGTVDVLVHVSGLSAKAGGGALRLFERAQEAVAAGARQIMGVSALDGGLGMSITTSGVATQTPDDVVRFGGMRGVLKAVAQEYPSLNVRMIDLHPSELPADSALIIASELAAEDGLIEVGRTPTTRASVVVMAEERSLQGADNGLLGLDSNAVVLLTGGARGITARVAEGFAERLRCRIVVAGRTLLPNGDEGLGTLEAPDAIAIRQTLARADFGPPTAIEAETRRILSDREVRQSLKTLRALGATVDYRSIDVRDKRAVHALVASIYQTYGRLDGVIHGAGVREDCRLADKTPESFSRVFDTKVSSALALYEAVADDVRFVVLFASVSGLFGNRGQVDYAAANDALAQLARRWDRQIAGQVVAIDWGPWNGSGMVSPELAREFSKRRVGLLEPEDAIRHLFDELVRGTDPEVVVMRAHPKDFVGAPLVSSGADVG